MNRSVYLRQLRRAELLRYAAEQRAMILRARERAAMRGED